MVSTAMIVAACLAGAGAPGTALPNAVGLIVEGPVDAELTAFLTERVRDAWGVELRDGAAVAPAKRAFRIVLALAAQGEIAARVEEGGAVVASRELPLRDDPRATDAIVWLFVKSAITRALLDAPKLEMTPVAPPLARTHVVAPVAADALEQTPLGDWSVNLLAGAHLEDGAPADGGLAGAVTRRVAGSFAVGFEAGYRHEVRGRELVVHHVPISVLGELDLGTLTGIELPLSVGASVTADIGSARWIGNGNSATMPAFLAGPFARGRIAIAGSDAGQLALAIELGASFYLQGRKYLIDNDRELQDGAWTLRATTGLDWRWR